MAPEHHVGVTRGLARLLLQPHNLLSTHRLWILHICWPARSASRHTPHHRRCLCSSTPRPLSPASSHRRLVGQSMPSLPLGPSASSSMSARRAISSNSRPLIHSWERSRTHYQRAGEHSSPTWWFIKGCCSLLLHQLPARHHIAYILSWYEARQIGPRSVIPKMRNSWWAIAWELAPTQFHLWHKRSLICNRDETFNGTGSQASSHDVWCLYLLYWSYAWAIDCDSLINLLIDLGGKLVSGLVH